MKVKTIIYNILTFVFMGVALGSLIYPYLPTEFIEQFENINTLDLQVYGGVSGVLGSSLLIVRQLIKVSETKSTDNFITLAKNYLTLEEEVKSLKLEKKRENDLRLSEVKKLARIEKLLETDLNAKLSNKFLDLKIKEQIEGVLDDKE